jgi:hypothetical protein
MTGYTELIGIYQIDIKVEMPKIIADSKLILEGTVARLIQFKKFVEEKYANSEE